MHLLFFIVAIVILISCNNNDKKQGKVLIEEIKSTQIVDSIPIDSLTTNFLGDSTYTTHFTLREIIPGDQYDIGRGYNTINNEVTGKVVIYSDSRDLKTVSDGEALKTIYDLKVIKSSEQLKKMMDLETNASLKWGVFKGSAKYSYYNQVKIDQYSSLLVAKVKVKNSTEILSTSLLTTPARNLMQKSRKDFFDRYGDEYIYGRVTGGELYIFFQFSSNSKEELSKTNAALTASVKKFGSGASASAEFKSALSELKSSSELKVKIIREGTIESLPKTDLDSLINYAASFPEKVRTSRNPVTIEVITEPIINVENLPLTFSQSDLLANYKRKRKIENIAEKLDELKDATATSQFIKDNSSLFRETSIDSANKFLQSYRNIIMQLTDCANTCAISSTSCDGCNEHLDQNYEPYVTTLKDGENVVEVVEPQMSKVKKVEIPLGAIPVNIDTIDEGENVYLDFEGTAKWFNQANCRNLAYMPNMGSNDFKPIISVQQLRKSNPDEIVEDTYYDGKEIKLRKSGVIIRAKVLVQRNSGGNITVEAWPATNMRMCAPIKSITIRE